MQTAGTSRLHPLYARAAAAALLLACMLVAPATRADWYFGAKTGPMLLDRGDDPTNVGVLLGHEWGVVVGDLGIEAELTRTVDDGRLAGQDVEVDTRGLFAAFRTAGPLYLIAKAGRVRSEVDVNGSTAETENAYGAGLGFSIGVAQFELEFTRLHDDIDFLSLGVRF